MVIMAWPTLATAQAEGPITSKLPVNARIAAMGSAAIASSDGDAVLFNPAMLQSARGTSISFHTFGGGSIGGSYGTIQQLSSFTVGFGVQHLQWKSDSSTYGSALSSFVPSISDSSLATATGTSFILGVSKTFKGFRLGVSARHTNEHFADESKNIVSFDAAVARPISRGILTAVAHNIGNNFNVGNDTVHVARKAGIAFGFPILPMREHFDIGMLVQLAAEGSDWFVRPAMGAEIGYVPIEGVAIVARAGVRRTRFHNEYPVTGGTGVNIDRYSVDYTFEPSREATGGIHRIGIRFR